MAILHEGVLAPFVSELDVPILEETVERVNEDGGWIDSSQP
ncbi:MAG TPA: hypothetical protein VK116_05715 [Planctomycetota bacterium]|nr:hypothetical protein [Planctomycetota bacterium]